MLTQEQKDQRRGLLTSSLWAAALGLDPNKTPLQAKREVLGQGEEFQGNAATYRGNKLERVVLQEPADQLGLVFVPAPFRKHANGWSGDSCDALYYKAPYVEGLDAPELVGEGKTAGMGVADKYGAAGTDNIPVTAWVQSHCHLIHWPEAKRCVVPVLIGGWSFEFKLYFVERDEQLEGEMYDKLAKFHRDYIVANVDPPAQSGDLEWMHKAYTTATDERLMRATPEIDVLAAEYKAARTSSEEWEERYKNARAKLEQLIGGHSGVEGRFGKISFKCNAASQKIDWEVLATRLMKNLSEAERSHLLTAATKTIPGPRVFRPYWKKEK